MPSKRELYAAVVFFTLTAVAVVAFRRPFDLIGWACLIASVVFAVLGCVGLLKPDIAAGRRMSGSAASRRPAFVPERDLDEDEEPVGDPSAEEMRVLDATIAALQAVGGLEVGEVDARSLWTVARRLDPHGTVGIHEALGAFASLQGLGRTRIGRLTFVPSHTEYDAPLLAEITASVLTSLGRPVRPDDVTVTLPPDGGQGPAQISFPLDDTTRRVTCAYLWKYPPADLFPALARFGTSEDPRDLVGADPGDQTLLFAAIRSGTLAELNRRLPADHEVFYEA